MLSFKTKHNRTFHVVLDPNKEVNAAWMDQVIQTADILGSDAIQLFAQTKHRLIQISDWQSSVVTLCFKD